MVVLDFLRKLKWDLGVAFATHFLHDFDVKNENKNISFFELYQLTKFQYHTFFPFENIKQNVLLSSYLDNRDVINFKICLRSSSKAMADREKRGEDGNRKI